MKGNKSEQLNTAGSSLLTKISSSMKDDCLDNLLVTNQRVEFQRNEKLTRYFQKANSILHTIKRQQEEMDDVEQLKSADLILLQLRLRNMEHKIKQLQSSLKIKITRLAQEEQKLLSSFRQICMEIAEEEIADMELITEQEIDPQTPKNGLLPTAFNKFSTNKKRTELDNSHKIIEQLVQEIQSFKQEARSSTYSKE